MSSSSSRTPSRSWRSIGKRWLANSQPGRSAADIELCVPANVTWSSRSPHRSRRPLQPTAGTGGSAAGRAWRAVITAAATVDAPTANTAPTASAITGARPSRGPSRCIRRPSASASSASPRTTRPRPARNASARTAASGSSRTRMPTSTSTAPRAARTPADFAGRTSCCATRRSGESRCAGSSTSLPVSASAAPVTSVATAQRPQVAQVRVVDRGQRRSERRVASQLRRFAARDRPPDGERDREQAARDGDHPARQHQRGAPPRGQRDARRQQDHGHGRQHEARRPPRGHGAHGLHPRVAGVEREQLGVDLGRHRAGGRGHDAGELGQQRRRRLPDVEHEALLAAFDEHAVGVARRHPDALGEQPRVRERLERRDHQRAHGQQFGRARVDELAGELLGGRAPHRFGLQRGDRARLEAVGVDQLHAHVERGQAGCQQQSAEHDQDGGDRPHHRRALLAAISSSRSPIRWFPATPRSQPEPGAALNRQPAAADERRAWTPRSAGPSSRSS